MKQIKIPQGHTATTEIIEDCLVVTFHKIRPLNVLEIPNRLYGTHRLVSTKQRAEGLDALAELLELYDAWGGCMVGNYNLYICYTAFVFKDKETREEFRTTFKDLIDKVNNLI